MKFGGVEGRYDNACCSEMHLDVHEIRKEYFKNILKILKGWSYSLVVDHLPRIPR